ncbi:MAG: hypothetical protein U0457_11175 [Candidatus Sericytochromatia bacterium]
MEIIKTEFENLLILKAPKFIDERGAFSKIFNSEILKELNFEVKEFLFTSDIDSISKYKLFSSSSFI